MTIALHYISSFGHKFDLNDDLLKQMSEIMTTLETDNIIVGLADTSFIFKIIYYNRYKKTMELNKRQRKLIEETYDEHEKTFQSNNNRDFIDSLLASRIEAEAEGEENVTKYVNKTNIIGSVVGLFFAGTFSTREILMWCLLYLSLHQEMQDRIRKEIDAVLPNEDDIPTLDMRDLCPFTYSFILEILRVKGTLTLPHKAMQDTEIVGHKILSGTWISGALYKAMWSNECWPNASEFKPERFIDEEAGKVSSRPNPYFLSFGGGRRACVGEKLAMANLFLILVRIIQKTRSKGSFHPVMKEGLTRESLLYGDYTQRMAYSAGQFYLKLE